MRIGSEEKADLTFTNEQAREMFHKTLGYKKEDERYKFYGHADNYKSISVFLLN